MRFLLLSITSLFLFYGCQSSGTLISPPQNDEEVHYSAIYLIHADANYLYHDENGHAHRADERVLAESRKIGEEAKQGEIFIFHQKPEKKILGLFPRKNRRMLHYRNGELVNEGRYSPDSEGVFAMESELYRQNRATGSTANFLLYFGHEIPVRGGQNYHYSQRSVEVNVQTFSEGVKNFLLPDEGKFDLTVLSTCNNGNPKMAGLLQPITKTILASPQNLHLSHIDTDALLLMENETDHTGKTIAESMAENTFKRLKKNIQTEITLFVYDMEEVGSYLPDFNAKYEIHLSEIKPVPFEDNIDCAELPLFADLDFSSGVKGWYSSPGFGRRSGSESHSGWGCRPLR